MENESHDNNNDNNKKTGYLLTPNLLQAAGSSDSRLQSDLQSFCSKKEIKWKWMEAYSFLI